MTGARRTTFFEGELLDVDDFRLEQDALRGRRRWIQLEIGANGTVERWTQVDDLAASGPDDRHFVLDRETGRVVFGDGEHGRRPPAGSRVEASYAGAEGGRSWLTIPFAAIVAGFLTALLRHRRRRR